LSSAGPAGHPAPRSGRDFAGNRRQRPASNRDAWPGWTERMRIECDLGIDADGHERRQAGVAPMKGMAPRRWLA
jgi:hypothetical protein